MHIFSYPAAIRIGVARCVLNLRHVERVSDKHCHKTVRRVWYQKKKAPPQWEPLHPIPRTATGSDPKQRPAAQKVQDLPLRQEDSCYQLAEMGRVSAEIVPIWTISVDPADSERVSKQRARPMRVTGVLLRELVWNGALLR